MPPEAAQGQDSQQDNSSGKGTADAGGTNGKGAAGEMGEGRRMGESGTGKDEGKEKGGSDGGQDDELLKLVPDKFKKDGKPDFKSLATSYRELERVQFSRREDIAKQLKADQQAEAEKDMPKAPVDYTFAPVKDDKGNEIKLNPDDPLTKWFQNVAWEFKLPQEKFQKLAADYIKVDMMRGPDWNTEAKELGPSADLRLDRVAGWARGNLPQDLYDTFSRIPATAQMTKLFEHVMQLTGEPAFVPSEGGEGFKESLTREDIKAMVADPKYWRDKDPRHVAQVRAAYKRIGQNGRA